MPSLRFANKIRLYLDMKSLTVSQAAEKSGLKIDQMEHLLEGKNVPLAPTALKVMEGLGIKLKSEDFEEEGLD